MALKAVVKHKSKSVRMNLPVTQVVSGNREVSDSISMAVLGYLMFDI